MRRDRVFQYEDLSFTSGGYHCFFCGKMANGGLLVIGPPPEGSPKGTEGNDLVICTDCYRAPAELFGALWEYSDILYADNVAIELLQASYYKGLAIARNDRLQIEGLRFRRTDQQNDELHDHLKKAHQTIKSLESRLEVQTDNYAGYVYLMKRKDGAHKIGLSEDVDRRLSQIQREFEEVELLHTIRCDDMRTAESMLHNQFSEKRLDGEWFDLEQHHVEYIHSLTRFEDGWFLRRSITSEADIVTEIPY